MIRGKKPNADLRLQYPRVFRISLLASAILNGFVILLYPIPEREAYAAPEKAVIIQLEEIPETRQERRPPPPPRPVVPIATDDPDIPDDVTIEETDLDLDLDDLMPPPPLVEEEFEEEEEEEEELVELWKVEKQPAPINWPQPAYPEIARKAGIEDKVFVTVLVDKEGNVEKIGELKGAEVFHDAVHEAVKKVKFTPALQNDKPVKVWVSMPITFKLT